MFICGKIDIYLTYLRENQETHFTCDVHASIHVQIQHMYMYMSKVK